MSSASDSSDKGLFPSEFATKAFYLPDHEKRLQPLSFAGREYLIPVYDTPAKRVLLCCARQTEKCAPAGTRIRLHNGEDVPIETIKPGDRVATLLPDGSHIGSEHVVWARAVGIKPCVRVETRQGHVALLAETHPVRQWERWTPAGELSAGSRIAVVRKAGDFITDAVLDERRVRLTAYMLGDGSCGGSNFGFTTIPGEKRDEFISDVESLGIQYRTYVRAGNAAVDIRLSRGDNQLRRWLTEDELWGKKSGEKFLPPWVFNLSRAQTALFINRLWSTDGSIKAHNEKEYNLCYCSISWTLVVQLQALLHKFGIPSRIRVNLPAIYKRRGEFEKVAYILRVETQPGVTTFLRDIGALGKSSLVEAPARPERNNRDTYPLESIHDIEKLARGRFKYREFSTAEGCRLGLRYSPSKEKLAQYLRTCSEQVPVDDPTFVRISAHLNTDVFWDEVTSVTPHSTALCYDFEVRGTHNYVADGIITHNSTALGNRILSYCYLRPFLKCLYVSPTERQTTTFSRDRLSQPMRTSPIFRHWFGGKDGADNILYKAFNNESSVTLRYAYLSADGVRGVSGVDVTLLDEIQDILWDVVPVIEECSSHSPIDIRLYAGTPKSFDNTIGYLWHNFSTQYEWVIPCDSCGSAKQYRHWNVIGYDNIGLKGLCCSRCGGLINARHRDARWASTRSKAWLESPPASVGIPYEGYRIPQPIVQWSKWENILDKKTKYSVAQFHNEVLGLSYDTGEKLIRKQALVDQSREHIQLNDLSCIQGKGPLFMGIDWGGGGEANPTSFTDVVIGGYAGDRFVIPFMKRYQGREAEFSVMMADICSLIEKYNIHLVGCDYGGGIPMHDELIRRFGVERIARYQYTSAKKLYFDTTLTRFMANRTEVMMAVINAVNRMDTFEFPSWPQWESPFGDCFLSLYAEYNASNNTTTVCKTAGRSDDLFHSVVYCLLASMIYRPRPDILTPDKDR